MDDSNKIKDKNITIDKYYLKIENNYVLGKLEVSIPYRSILRMFNANMVIDDNIIQVDATDAFSLGVILIAMSAMEKGIKDEGYNCGCNSKPEEVDCIDFENEDDEYSPCFEYGSFPHKHLRCNKCKREWAEIDYQQVVKNIKLVFCY